MEAMHKQALDQLRAGGLAEDVRRADRRVQIGDAAEGPKAPLSVGVRDLRVQQINRRVLCGH